MILGFFKSLKNVAQQSDPVFLKLVGLFDREIEQQKPSDQERNMFWTQVLHEIVLKQFVLKNLLNQLKNTIAVLLRTLSHPVSS